MREEVVKFLSGLLFEEVGSAFKAIYTYVNENVPGYTGIRITADNAPATTLKVVIFFPDTEWQFTVGS